MLKLAISWTVIFATIKLIAAHDDLFNEILDEMDMDKFDFKQLEQILDSSSIEAQTSYSSFKHDLMTQPISALVNNAVNKPRRCTKSGVVNKFLCRYQAVLHDLRKLSSNLLFTKDTNLTTFNSNRYSTASSLITSWNLNIAAKARAIKKKYTRKNAMNEEQKRMFKLITRTADPKEKNLRSIRSSLDTTIRSIYSKAKICNGSKCYKYEPGIIGIMSKSRNYDTLLWAWKSWRDAIGPKIRGNWLTITNIDNIGAWENNYADYGAYWRSIYEDATFEEEIEALWEELKPLYMQLHAYVRGKLRDYYGPVVGAHDPIPAHLLGNIWAMKWDHIIDIVKPYPDVSSFEVTTGMKKNNYTVSKMFHLADSFYQSMGLPAMPASFWSRSMFTRPANKPVVCYASAFNCEDTDVRLKMCAEVNAEYFYVVHHEMGHCQYYLAYNKNQPEIFQSGANNGFHEAIGDTAALSVISITHLKKLGVIQGNTNVSPSTDKKIQLNMLMTKALGKLAFYPYALTMAKYRWKLFRGDIKETELNSAWWELRKKYQGIRPPIPRSENDFDPGCKYHITYMVPYIRYFIAHVLQFQFYERLCKLSGHKDPLHLCDFQGSKKAGKAFEEMLGKGDSQNWKTTLAEFLGSPNSKMSVKSVIKYFKPLLDWLKSENVRLKNTVGWD